MRGNGNKNPANTGNRSSRSTDRGSRGRSRQKSEQDPIYRGPVILPKADQEVHQISMNQTLIQAFTTSIGGVVDASFGNDPSSLPNWATFAGRWNEYRCLAMQLSYVPIKQVATNAYGIAFTTTDHDVAGALGSATAAANHESFKPFTCYEKWIREVKANGVDEFDWFKTSSPLAKMYIKVYSQNNQASTTLGTLFVTYMLEFRGLA